jgi:hypothetical protein
MNKTKSCPAKPTGRVAKKVRTQKNMRRLGVQLGIIKK